MAAERYYTAFNGLVSEMLTDVTARFPDSAELKTCEMLHTVASRVDASSPHDHFERHAIRPYGEELASHDEAFFMRHDFDELPENGAGILQALKGLWARMGEADRRGVHDYIDMLLSVHAKIEEAQAGEGAEEAEAVSA
jgi:hypothetical protein